MKPDGILEFIWIYYAVIIGRHNRFYINVLYILISLPLFLLIMLKTAIFTHKTFMMELCLLPCLLNYLTHTGNFLLTDTMINCFFLK